MSMRQLERQPRASEPGSTLWKATAASDGAELPQEERERDGLESGHQGQVLYRETGSGK